MKRTLTISLGIVAVAILGLYLLRCGRPGSPNLRPIEAALVAQRGAGFGVNAGSLLRTNALGDTLTDNQDPIFLNQVFPGTRKFFETLDGLGLNPIPGGLQPASCDKIRIIHIPNGIICRFLIGDGWSATYKDTAAHSGMMYFGQRGADNPIRAISHANTDALRRLAADAVTMSEGQVWEIANGVADTFGIDPSKFEKPRMYEEGLFEYRLGIYTIEYRKKGSDPINGLNYTRDFSLKAVSATKAALVRYSDFEAH